MPVPEKRLYIFVCAISSSSWSKCWIGDIPHCYATRNTRCFSDSFRSELGDLQCQILEVSRGHFPPAEPTILICADNVYAQHLRYIITVSRAGVGQRRAL
jgi:hypothetical protein